MPAGMYRDLVTIQQDSSTADNPGQDWTGTALFSNVPCQIEAVGGNESLRGRQIEAGVDYIVTMHELPGITSAMRCSVTVGHFAGSVLNIVRVNPKVFRGRAMTVELFCREVVA